MCDVYAWCYDSQSKTSSLYTVLRNEPVGDIPLTRCPLQILVVGQRTLTTVASSVVLEDRRYSGVEPSSDSGGYAAVPAWSRYWDQRQLLPCHDHQEDNHHDDPGQACLVRSLDNM